MYNYIGGTAPAPPPLPVQKSPEITYVSSIIDRLMKFLGLHDCFNKKCKKIFLYAIGFLIISVLINYKYFTRKSSCRCPQDNLLNSVIEYEKDGVTFKKIMNNNNIFYIKIEKGKQKYMTISEITELEKYISGMRLNAIDRKNKYLHDIGE